MKNVQQLENKCSINMRTIRTKQEHFLEPNFQKDGNRSTLLHSWKRTSNNVDELSTTCNKSPIELGKRFQPTWKQPKTLQTLSKHVTTTSSNLEVHNQKVQNTCQTHRKPSKP